MGDFTQTILQTRKRNTKKTTSYYLFCRLKGEMSHDLLTKNKKCTVYDL